MVATQLPEGASLERTGKVMDEVGAVVRDVPGVDHAITIGGVSLFDNNASLANAGIVYVILKDWSQRGAGEDLLSVYTRLQARLDENPDARVDRGPAAADPGPRARRRLPDAGAGHRRVLRLCQAAGTPRTPSWRRAMPSRRSRG